MERYLEGEEISTKNRRRAQRGTNHATVSGHVRRRDPNLGTNQPARRDRRGLPSPVKHGGLEVGTHLEPVEDKESVRVRVQDRADPFAGRINLSRLPGVMRRTRRCSHAHAHQGADRQLVTFEGSQTGHTTEFGPRHRRVAKLKGRRRATGSPRATSRSRCRASSCSAGDGVRDRAEEQRATRKGVTRSGGCREDPTIDLHAIRRPASRSSPGSRRCTSSDRRAAEVAVRRRGQPQAAARPVPETIASPEGTRRHKKQTAARSVRDCHIEIEPRKSARVGVRHAIKGAYPTGHSRRKGVHGGR